MFKSFFKKIGNFFGDLIGGIGDFLGGVVTGAVKLVTNIVDGFLGAFGFSFDLPEYDSPSAFQNENQGILLNTQSAVKGIPVVYGERQVGGTRVYMATGGTSNKYLYVVLAIAEGEIDGYYKVFINDEEQELLDGSNTARGFDNKITQERDLTLSSITPTGEDSTYYRDGRSLAVMSFYTGRENQNANSLFVDAAPNWNSNGRLRGVAYIAARFEFLNTAENPWQGIPEIRVQIRGKKVLKTYTSAMNTSSNISTYESQVSSFSYSNNPADCLLDYLRNPRYGKGLKDNRINFGTFDTQQAVFEQTYQLQNDPLFISFLVRCDAVINTEDTMFNNTKRLLQSCRSFLPYVNGKYELRFEANFAASDAIEITDDMIIGNISIQSEDKNAKYNEAQITYANEDKNYDSDTVIYQNATHIANDGEPLILTTSHPTLTNYYRVLQYAKYLVERSRNQLAVSLKVTNEGQSVVAGDVVRITHKYKNTTTGTDLNDYLFKATEDATGTVDPTAPGMLFRVVSTKLNYDNTVDLQLLEHKNTVFAISEVDLPTPPQCPPNYRYVEGQGCVYNGDGTDPQCPDGYVYDPNKQNDDGTIGGCVEENPNQCPDGYYYNPSTGQCEIIPPEDKIVRAVAYQNNGRGYVDFTIDCTGIPNAERSYIILQYTGYSSGAYLADVVSQIGTGEPAKLNTTISQVVNKGGLQPGDVLYYKVYMIDTGSNAPTRIDQENVGDDNYRFSLISIPYGDSTIVSAAAQGSGTQPQGGDPTSQPSGVPVTEDDYIQSTSQEGFD